MNWHIIQLPAGTLSLQPIKALRLQILTGHQAEFRFLQKVVYWPNRELRRHTVYYLASILQGMRYKKHWRVRVIELLEEVLMKEESLQIRGSIVECFQEDKILALSKTAERIAAWWRGSQDSIFDKVILCSDDDPQMLRLYKSILTQIGFKNVYCETDPLKTIETASRVRPSLIITDMRKPRMSGYEMATAIKGDPSLAEIPVLLSSAIAMTKREYYESDIFCAAIQQPFNIDALAKLTRLALTGKLPRE
jgi:CheY-like chemotaxis protein